MSDLVSMDTEPFQILIAEDNPVDVALVREAPKHHQVECVLQVVADGEKALGVIDNLDADSDAPAAEIQQESRAKARSSQCASEGAQ